jgi:hypothetical protein
VPAPWREYSQNGPLLGEEHRSDVARPRAVQRTGAASPNYYPYIDARVDVASLRIRGRPLGKGRPSAVVVAAAARRPAGGRPGCALGRSAGSRGPADCGPTLDEVGVPLNRPAQLRSPIAGPLQVQVFFSASDTMPLPARYDGGADDSERLKVALGKESNWQLSWNELRFRQAGYPPPFAGTFAESRGTSQTSSQTSLSRRRSLMNGEGLRLDEFLVPSSPSLASSFASTLKASRSHCTLNPIHDGNAVSQNDDDRTWKARHATEPVHHARPPPAAPTRRAHALPPPAHALVWCSSSYASPRSAHRPSPPLSATCVAQTSYGELFKAPPMSETCRSPFSRKTGASCSSLASHIPDDATLDALLLRRSRARGRGGGASVRLVDKVESKWTLLYGR